jgi:ABC-type Fe3+-hydroxamate transport system substrate-binding protein
MTEQYLGLLEGNNYSKQLNRLEKKLKNKRVVIYGIGEFFQTIMRHYDLSKLNIVALSDRNISEQGSFLGYKTCSPSNILEYKPDYILVGTFNYINVIEYLESLYPDVKIFPLMKKSAGQIWKEVWS